MTKFNHKAMADRFAKVVKNAGGSVVMSYAGTGSIYATVSADEGSIKVRFADHGECYCNEDISVDPYGCTYEQAIRATMRETGIDLSSSIRALEAAANRRAKARAEFEARIAPIIEDRNARHDAKMKFQATFIADNYPDYDTRSTKSRKRIRAKANAAFSAQMNA